MSYKIRIVDTAWKKKKDRDLLEDIFTDDNINEWLIHEYVVMYLANQRQSTAHTKTRWEVKRSWRKLFRQKGTGRARVGDAWSPIRRSWWVAFGPRNTKDWSKTMPKKMRRKALCWALTLKVKADQTIGLDWFALKAPKTSEALNVLKNIGVSSEKTLVVLSGENDNTIKSLRNIENVNTVVAKQLNAYDVLTHKKVVFTTDGLDSFESLFTS